MQKCPLYYHEKYNETKLFFQQKHENVYSSLPLFQIFLATCSVYQLTHQIGGNQKWRSKSFD